MAARFDFAVKSNMRRNPPQQRLEEVSPTARPVHRFLRPVTTNPG